MKWRVLHNEELHNLCISSSIVRVVKSRKYLMDWIHACMGEAYRILVEKPLGRLTRRKEDDINVYLHTAPWPLECCGLLLFFQTDWRADE
jgi:hypothetical protein